MSDNFGQKDYGDYFKTLEEQLNNSDNDNDSPKKEVSVKVHETKGSVSSHQKKSGFYAVFRLRKSILALVLAVVLVITGATVITGLAKSDVKPNLTKNQETEQKQPDVEEEENTLISYDFPENVPDIIATNDANYAIVIDKTTNKVIAARNPHSKAFPASTTKVMTLLVAVENITDMEDTFTMSYAITDPLFVRGASVAGFLNGEVVSMTDLLYGLILPSGADAAVGLATKLAGSEEAFVELMNERAREMGLENTHFANVSGLHDENNYTTAHDMAIILDTALQNNLCKTILSTKKYTTEKTPQNPKGILLSSTLFDYMYGTEPEIATIMGGKTGFVNQSGYCIASYGRNNTNGNEYIIVTMKNSSRWPAFHGQIDLYKEYAK